MYSTSSSDRAASADPSGRDGQPRLAPVSSDERIHALDLLRGWAMFGVLWSNLNDAYFAPEPTTGLDRGLLWMQDNLIGGRFYTLLMLLFGIGFGIQLLRADGRGVDIRATYYRRCLSLLAIGVVHGYLVWPGDILTMYALVAFALAMFRTSSTPRILTAAILLWFLGDLFVRDVTYLAGLRFMNGGGGSEFMHNYFVLAHGSWLQVQQAGAASYLNGLGRGGLPSYFGILATFLLGLWAMKSGYFRRVTEDTRSTRRLLFVGVVAAAVGYVSTAYADMLWPPFQAPDGVQPTFPYPFFQLNLLRELALRFFDWAVLGSSLAYATLLLLLWQRPLGARLLRPLAATGRMALTTYLTQSVVCTLLFYDYGLGWLGQATFAGILLITLVLFAAQMAASSWWLNQFRFGPVEWLWRRLTYGQVPAMRVQLPAVV